MSTLENMFTCMQQIIEVNPQYDSAYLRLWLAMEKNSRPQVLFAKHPLLVRESSIAACLRGVNVTRTEMEPT